MHNGSNVDVVLGYGPRAIAFHENFNRIKNTLPKEKREQIKAEREKLQNAWFLKKYRYNRFKKRVAKDIGLKQYYF